MTQPELDKIKTAMQERQACGHTNEEHLAAALIVMGCEKLCMPYDVMVAACKIIGGGDHETPKTTDGQELFMAPAGRA